MLVHHAWRILVLLLLTVAGCRAKVASAPPRSGDAGSTSSARVSSSPGVSSPPPPASPGDAWTGAEAEEAAGEATVSADAPTSAHRGLGTEFGEHRVSRSLTTRFVREHRRPEVTLALWYDDWQGVADAAASHGVAPSLSVDSSAGSFVVSLLDEFGRPLPATDVGGRRYAIGQVGQRYQIAIENHSPERWEVVASVDGLDVIDGRTAAFHKRGYVVDPWSSITIEGWRTSEDAIAAFRFGELPDSYAARTGQPRNIGVVGVAFFRERGASRFRDDVDRRHRADPFPGRFAPPPPR